MKRGRLDSDATKNSFFNSAGQNGDNSDGQAFKRASADTLSSRRIVTALRQPDKKRQFARHIEALNKSFFQWFKDQINENPFGDFASGVQDYVDYCISLEEQYLRKHGEVLTFGSGDCGQLAHGMEEYEDIVVKFPRTVYSLRDKNVYAIACGGIHNAIYTDSGQVYTWGK